MHAFSTIFTAAFLASLNSAAPTSRQATSGAPAFTLYVNSLGNDTQYDYTLLTALYYGNQDSVLGTKAGITASNFSLSVAVDRTSTDLDNTAYYLQYEFSDSPAQYNNAGTDNEEFFSFGVGYEEAEFALGYPNTEQIGIYVTNENAQFEFYICEQTLDGTTYEVLNWVKDFPKPSDPRCAPVALYKSS